MSKMNEVLELLKTLRKDANTQGINVGTGLNYYLLEPQAKNIYPVFFPLLESIPRYSPTFNGVSVGGTGVNWKAIISIDQGGATPGYPATSEGNRNAFMNIQEKDYFAPYRYLGKDTEVSFQAQQTGMGFEDNIGLAQISLLNALLNDEERMILYGNSGTNGNGYQLGTTPTPVIALASGGSITSGKTCSFFCVALTPWGARLASATGVQAPFTRTNADGSQDLINGGTAAVSAASNVVTTTGSTLSVVGTVATGYGDVAYAWFLDSTDASSPSPANAYFVGVTYVPTITVLTLPSTSNQKASANGLSTDNSANALDMDGLFTWNVNYAQASTPSYYKNLGGANLTSNGDGTIAEFETLLDYLWTQYKVTPDRAYMGGTLINAVTKKITGTGVANGVQRFTIDTNSSGQITGGTNAVGYRTKYGPGTGKTIELMTHPWLPQGQIYFDTINNPYPAAGSAIPAVRRIATLEDHFSIKWPYRRLQHEVGVYAFETLQNYIPFITASLVCAGTN